MIVATIDTSTQHCLTCCKLELDCIEDNCTAELTLQTACSNCAVQKARPQYSKNVVNDSLFVEYDFVGVSDGDGMVIFSQSHHGVGTTLLLQ